MSPLADRVRTILSLFQTTIVWMVLRRHHPMVNTPELCHSMTCSLELAGFSMGFFSLVAAMVYQISFFTYLMIDNFCQEQNQEDDQEDNEEDQEENDVIVLEDDDSDSSYEEGSISSMEEDEEVVLDDQDNIMIKNAVYTELRNRKLIPKENN